MQTAKEESYQRQKLPKVYQLNGAVYVVSIAFVQREREFIGEETLGYVMPQERSYDIDTMIDFQVGGGIDEMPIDVIVFEPVNKTL